MWIARIIYHDPSIAQLQFVADSEAELKSRVLSFIKASPHDVAFSYDEPAPEPSEWHEVFERMERVIDENGETSTQIVPYTAYYYPTDFVVQIEDKTAEIAEQNRLAALQASGRADRQKCEAALDLIAGYNRQRSLSIEQITQMQLMFANAETALRANRPDLARLAIEQIEPDNILVTQQMKTDVLGILQ